MKRLTPAARARVGMSLPGLARPFVLPEDRLDPTAPARLYGEARRVVRADAAEEVDAAFARVEVGLAEGLHAAGVPASCAPP